VQPIETRRETSPFCKEAEGGLHLVEA